MNRLKQFYRIIFFALLSINNISFAQDNLINKVKEQGSEKAENKFGFQITKDIKATEVKNQAHSGTCWSYATNSFVESEMLRKGKTSVDLSEMFVVRQVYLDKGEKYVRLEGHLNFAQGGALPDVMYVLKKYGAVPQEVYQGLNYGESKNKHDELENVLKGMLDAVIKNPNGKLSTAWKPAFEASLNAYLGAFPEKFNYNGKSYTPRTFADNVVGINPDDYIQLTSFSHQPFYSQVFIEVPDNWAWGVSYNLPLDEMQAAVNNAINNNYTVSWAADVSEKGFSLKNGVAIVPNKTFDDMSKEEKESMFDGPKEEMKINQAIRQLAYDNYETTDDHAMHITGKAKDVNGNEYYLVKNSWGDRENDFRNGYLFVSDSFFRYKTISVLLHKDALSKDLKNKLKL
jgi:bleomycin hydrolase